MSQGFVPPSVHIAHVLFFCLLFFIQVLEFSKAKCLSTNLVTGFSFVFVCLSLSLLLKASSLRQICRVSECVCVRLLFLMYLILAFISSNRLAFMWHIYLVVVVLVELIRLVERFFPLFIPFLFFLSQTGIRSIRISVFSAFFLCASHVHI